MVFRISLLFLKVLEFISNHNFNFLQIDVAHPAAKSMIELSRAQDEEVGDGTTSVIILAGEVLAAVESFLERDIHPTVIVGAYFKALDDLNSMTRSMSVSTFFHLNHTFRQVVCIELELTIFFYDFRCLSTWKMIPI